MNIGFIGNLCIVAAIAPGAVLNAQLLKGKINFDELSAKAVESVDVNLEGPMLQLASKFLDKGDVDEAKVKKLLTGLKGVYVKSFEFDKEGQYADADLNSIRRSLRAPEWSRIVGVKSKKDKDNAEIYMRTDGSQTTGLMIIATEPKELTIVNIEGKIDMAELSDLGGHFGIPKMALEMKPPKDASK